MATIDKPLPNVSETVVEVPKQEELIQERDEIIEKEQINKATSKLQWMKKAVQKSHLTQEQ